jgi:hypothetical protein
MRVGASFWLFSVINAEQGKGHTGLIMAWPTAATCVRPWVVSKVPESALVFFAAFEVAARRRGACDMLVTGGSSGLAW